MKYPSAYISGALTVIDPTKNVKRIYELLGSWCEEAGVHAYVPHLKADPVLFPTLSAREVWELDVAAVTKADLIIAYVGQPSLGTGGELEIARMAGKTIVMWSFEGEPVTRFVRGNPGVSAHFVVKDEQQLRSEITAFIVGK
jgi:nucleoside 2-deoxyribosyltransferase